MSDLRERLLRYLGYYRRDPPLRWHLEDTCFLVLDVFRYIHMHETADIAKAATALLQEHYPVCGGCVRNVAARWAAATDRGKREVYGSLHILAIQALGDTLSNLRLIIRNGPGGAWVIMGPPPGTEKEISEIEIFAPRSESGPGLQVIKVCSQEVFDNPAILFQQLDESNAMYSKQCWERIEWHALAMASLAQRRRMAVFVSWKGQTKQISGSLDMWSRYRGLIENSLRGAPDVDQVDEYGPPSEGTQLLELVKLAKDYDGRSWFSGYAKQKLRYRRIDRRRVLIRDKKAFVPSEMPSDPKPARSTDGEASERSELHRAVVERSKKAWGEGIDSFDTRIDLDDRLDRLAAVLTSREKEIVDLLRADPDLTDRELGERLGVTRETICRDRKQIREKAATVL